MRVRRIANLTLVMILTVVVCGKSVAVSDDVLRTMESEFTKIVDDVGPAIVEITARKGNLTRKAQPSAVREDIGTGIIINREGYIVTTESVVGGADKIGVVLADEKAFEAKLLGVDPETDIALIKIDAENLPIAPLGDSDKVRSGSWVITIGRSYGKSPTVSFGIVSGMESLPDRPAYYDAIKINAAVSPGNSGGGVIDMDGKVVGIITAALAEPRAIDFMFRSPELESLELPDLPELRTPELLSPLPRDEWLKMERLREEMIKMQQQMGDRLKNLDEMGKRWAREWENREHPENIKQITEISKQLAQEQSQIARTAEEMAEMNRQLAQKQKELARNTEEMAKINKQLVQIQKDRLETAKEMAEISRQLAQEQKELLKNTTARALPRGRFFGRQEESFAIPINFAKTIIDGLMEHGEIERGYLGVDIRPVRYWEMERLGMDNTEGLIVGRVLDSSPAARAGIREDDVIIGFGSEKAANPTDFTRMVAATKPYTKVTLTIIRDKQKQTLDVEIGKRPK